MIEKENKSFVTGPASWLLTHAGNNRKEEKFKHCLPGRKGVKGREREKDNVRENTSRKQTWALGVILLLSL